MFPNTRRAFSILLRTPLIPPPAGPQAVELTSFSSAAGPSRPRAASRTFSGMSTRSTHVYSRDMNIARRGYASDHGKKELYSDESGSTGAGIDDVAHTDAAFDSDPNPSSSAKKVENEAGKDFTKQSPASKEYSQPPGKQGEPRQNDQPLNTSKSEAEGRK